METAMIKVYLIKLEGMGDKEWTLVDQTAWDYLLAVEQRKKPSVPAALVDTYLDYHSTLMPGEQYFGDLKADQEDARIALTPDARSSSPGNDVALALPAAKFNGEICRDASVRKVNAFCKKHGLTLVDEYEGVLY